MKDPAMPAPTIVSPAPPEPDATAVPRDPDAAAVPAAPWWRFPIVWFALAGPALVVVAGVVTAAIAVRHADVVVSETPAQQVARHADLAAATAPALQARNHAATPAP
jgi:hypothetical protein